MGWSRRRGRAAIAPAAPHVHGDAPGNLAFDWSIGDRAKVEASRAHADRVVTASLPIARITHLPIEPRAVLGRYDPFDDGYTLWSTAQMPHLVRRLLAESSLKVAEHRLRVIAPDVGGGFG